jgi:hypothetical protein
MPNVSALDLSLFDKSNTYNFQAKGAFSYVTGDDPHDGFSTYASIGKVSGKWQWEASNLIKSKDYDPNDLGILFRANEMVNSASISYNQFTPTKIFNFRKYEINIDYANRFQPFSFATLEINGDFFACV